MSSSRHHPTSTPPAFTPIFIGNGDMLGFVMGGTAVRPCSEDVRVIIVCRLFVSVEARFSLNVMRSSRNRLPPVRILLCEEQKHKRTLFRRRLAYFRVYKPAYDTMSGGNQSGRGARKPLFPRHFCLWKSSFLLRVTNYLGSSETRGAAPHK